MSDGFVVTPSMMPSGASASISLRFPESMNNFMGTPSGLIIPLPRGDDLSIALLADVGGRRVVGRVNGVGVGLSRLHGRVAKRRLSYRIALQRPHVDAGGITAKHDISSQIGTHNRRPGQRH